MAEALKSETNIELEIITVLDAHFNRESDRWKDIDVSAHRYFGPGNFRFSPGLFWRILRSNTDVMHVHGVWSFHCLAVLIWSVLTGKPYIVSPHGMLEAWIVKRSPILKTIVSRLYQNRFLRRASIFHVLTDKERNDVATYAPNTLCAVAPNYVPLVKDMLGRPPWWKNEYASRSVFLFLGRIHEKKGWRELCDAWEELSAKRSGFSDQAQLVFCGWVDGSDEFEQRIEELGSRFGNVVYVGPQYGEAKAQSFSASDFLILPSKSEGLPMVVLEAWAHGLPALMTSACNLDIGFASNAASQIGMSSEAIVEGITNALGMGSADYENMQNSARMLVLDSFSAHSVATAIHAMYQNALRNSG